jgi:hypothetical protein
MPDDPIKDVATPPTGGAPYSGGSQPVKETPPEVPGPGRSVMQVVVLALAAMVVLAALLWVIHT